MTRDVEGAGAGAGRARRAAAGLGLAAALLLQGCAGATDLVSGTQARLAGRYEEAEQHLSAARREAERLGPEHPLLGHALHELGALRHAQGRFEEAESLLTPALAIRERAFGADHPAVLATRTQLLLVLNARGRYADAEEHARLVLAARERALDPRHPEVATALNNVAELALAQGRHAEADALHRRALAIREAARGPGHPDVAVSLNNLGELARQLGRYRDAEAFHRRALAIREETAGPQSLDVALTLGNLGVVQSNLGRYGEAEALHRRALALVEARRGPEHPDVVPYIGNLAESLREQGRHREAHPLFERALGIAERTLGPAHRVTANLLHNLGISYGERGLFVEAEQAFERALAAREQALSPGHPDVAAGLGLLARLHQFQERLVSAERLQRRALAMVEQSYGPEHPAVARELTRLAEILDDRGRSPEAVELIERGLGILERTLGPDHPELSRGLDVLATLLNRRGELARARSIRRRALDVAERAFGPDHMHVAALLNNLAGDHDTPGELWHAEPLLRRALTIRERAFGPEHPAVVVTLSNLALVLDDQGRREEARAVYERARRAQLAVNRRNVDLPDEVQRELTAVANLTLHRQARLLATLARQPAGAERASLIREAFLATEQGRAGAVQAALARASARAAAGDPATAAAAREVQDLRSRRNAAGAQLVAQYALPPDGRIPERVTSVLQLVRDLDARLNAATGQLLAAFPRYADLVAPEPIDLEGVGELLRPTEALVAYAALRDRLLIWLVRPDRPPVYQDVEVAKAALEQRVAAVRASLDQRDNPDLAAGLLAPFDVAGGHALHELLIAPIREHLEGIEDLLVVPGDVLLPLPFGVLLTRADGRAHAELAALASRRLHPAPAELTLYAGLPWLARELAITVLPSVTSLRALRRAAPGRLAAREPFIGVGDPVLEGTARRRGGAMVAVRGGRNAVDELRRLDRLPGARDELHIVAAALGAEPSRALFLGPRASEPEVRALNLSGRLERTRVLAFATHGLTAGELSGLTQPALVLTPPAAARADDDGLLTMEEILELRLGGTDWVILSACNTAAGDGGSDGLTGLARAFLFAGAQALLVSHWSVDDRATQTLMAEVFRRYAANPSGARAAALREGMLGLMRDAGGERAYFAHPYAWAPFFLVGEGAGHAPEVDPAGRRRGRGEGDQEALVPPAGMSMGMFGAPVSAFVAGSVAWPRTVAATEVDGRLITARGRRRWWRLARCRIRPGSGRRSGWSRDRRARGLPCPGRRSRSSACCLPCS